MTQTHYSIDEAIENATFDQRGVRKTVHYKGHTFEIIPKDLTSYETPTLFVVLPIGYIDELPKLKGFRRNTVKQWYTVKGSSYDNLMKRFLTAFDQIIDTPENTLYHNRPNTTKGEN